jgi:hypothetical protein
MLLVLATVGITRLNPGLGGGYLISIWSLCVGVGCLLVSIEALVSPSTWRSNQYEELEGDVEGEGSMPRRSLRHVEGADADERTPLILREDEAHMRSGDVHGKVEGDVEPLSTWWWIPQFLVSVPIPVILFGHVTMLLLDSMPQTLSDGASPWNGGCFWSELSLFVERLLISSISDVSIHPHLSPDSLARSSASAVRVQAPPISTSDGAYLLDIYPDDALRPSCVPILDRVSFKTLLPATRPVPIRSRPFSHDARAQLSKGDHIPLRARALPPLSRSVSAVIAGKWERRPVQKRRVKGRAGDV